MDTWQNEEEYETKTCNRHICNHQHTPNIHIQLAYNITRTMDKEKQPRDGQGTTLQIEITKLSSIKNISIRWLFLGLVM